MVMENACHSIGIGLRARTIKVSWEQALVSVTGIVDVDVERHGATVVLEVGLEVKMFTRNGFVVFKYVLPNVIEIGIIGDVQVREGYSHERHHPCMADTHRGPPEDPTGSRA